MIQHINLSIVFALIIVCLIITGLHANFSGLYHSRNFVTFDSFLKNFFNIQDIPRIDSIEQKSETLIELKWSIDNQANYNIIRYRVQYITKTLKEYREWPGK